MYLFDSFILSIIPRSPTLTQAMLWITNFGNWRVVVALIVIVSALCWSYKKRSFLIPFWASIAGNGIVVEGLKWIVRRPRPLGAEYLETSFSFPSAHAAIVVVLYGFIAFMLIRRMKNRVEKGLILAATLLIILVVGFSRISLGVHYPTDVAAGYIIGLGWLWAGIQIYNKGEKRSYSHEP